MEELSHAEGDEENMTIKCNANPRLDPGPQKEHQWDNWPNLNVYRLINRTINFLILIIIPWFYKMLILREAR